MSEEKENNIDIAKVCENQKQTFSNIYYTFEDEKIIEVLNNSEFYKGSNRNDFRIPKRRRKSFEDELKSIFNVSLTDKSEAVAK